MKAAEPEAAPQAVDELGCEVTQSSNLDGVRLQLDDGGCVFSLAEAAEGISFSYSLHVAHNVAGIVSPPADAGSCGAKSVGGLEVLEFVLGEQRRFCECDYVDCMAPDEEAVTLVPGTYESSFRWPGVEWDGESDTMTPYGPAFPVGSYRVEIVMTGRQPSDGGSSAFRVVTTLPIRIVP